jgi:hypothetical protein
MAETARIVQVASPDITVSAAATRVLNMRELLVRFIVT